MEDKHFYALTASFSGKTNVLLSEVRLSLPFNPQETKKPPTTWATCTAIWDTGATSSVITEKMVNTLGIKPIGKTDSTNTSGTELKNSYLINVLLPSKVLIAFVKVVECEKLVGGHGFLIGMDIIGAGDFSVTNVDGKTTMSYRIPSIKTIDYVEEAEDIKSRRTKFESIERMAQQRKKGLSKRTTKKRKKKQKQKKRKRKGNR